jgi:hypothetical protein
MYKNADDLLMIYRKFIEMFSEYGRFLLTSGGICVILYFRTDRGAVEKSSTVCPA